MNRFDRKVYATVPVMKTKGFTLIGIVVACMLPVMLSMIATTSTYNFVQAFGNATNQYQNTQNIMALHRVLAQAKMNYPTDLASELSDPSNQRAAQEEIRRWDTWANQNDNRHLIDRLINPDIHPFTAATARQLGSLTQRPFVAGNLQDQEAGNRISCVVPLLQSMVGSVGDILCATSRILPSIKVATIGSFESGVFLSVSK